MDQPIDMAALFKRSDELIGEAIWRSMSPWLQEHYGGEPPPWVRDVLSRPIGETGEYGDFSTLAELLETDGTTERLSDEDERRIHEAVGGMEVSALILTRLSRGQNEREAALWVKEHQEVALTEWGRAALDRRLEALRGT